MCVLQGDFDVRLYTGYALWSSVRRRYQSRLARSRPDRSSGELPNRQSGHVHLGPEQRAGQRILPWLEAFSRCGNEQLVQVRAAEGAGSDLFRWHLDHLIEHAVRGVASDGTALIEGYSDSALLIDRQAVRKFSFG